MSETIFKRFPILRAARFAWAVILLFGLPFSVLPSRATANGPSCARACCNKRKARSVASCESGSCHRASRAKRQRTNDPLSDSNEGQASFTRNCPPDCNVSTLSTRAQENFAATPVISPVGPRSAKSTVSTATCLELSEALLSQSAPRGPPAVSS
jgi:hypothetical protein